MRRITCAVLGAATVLPVAGCRPSDPKSPALPESRTTPCASRTATPTPRPTPTETRLAWRAEEMPDGSVRMTVGDVGRAPRHPKAVRVADHTKPSRESECDWVRVVKVRGWWCTTTAEKIALSGEIVLGGASPRAALRGGGFATECSERRPNRMRQLYQVERDSWSGWRSYGEPRRTAWTGERNQAGGPVSEVCPRGRVGTYNYRLRAGLEIDGIRVGNSFATGPRVRTHCGTGVS